MKTISNVQKTTMKLTAVLACFILLNLTVSAQNWNKEALSNYHSEEIVFAYAGNYYAGKTVSFDSHCNYSHNSELYKETVEEQLELEEWMVNENNFSRAKIRYEDAIENPLELESWMTNDNYFIQQITDSKSLVNNEKEDGLELENWMLSNNIWSIKNLE